MRVEDFLQRKPDYKAGNGAVEFSLCWPDHRDRFHKETDADQAIPDEAHGKIYDAFMSTARKLRAIVAQGVDTTMVKHSAVFWNDSHILHDRADGTYEKLKDRRVVRTAAFPSYMDHGTDAKFGDTSPVGQATGAPCASINADTVQRELEAKLPKPKHFRLF